MRRVSPYRAFQSLLQGRDALHVLCRRAISLEQYICTYDIRDHDPVFFFFMLHAAVTVSWSFLLCLSHAPATDFLREKHRSRRKRCAFSPVSISGAISIVPCAVIHLRDICIPQKELRHKVKRPSGHIDFIQVMDVENLRILGINVSGNVSIRELLTLSKEELLLIEDPGRLNALKEICMEACRCRADDVTAVRSSVDAYAVISPELRFLDHEECWIILLDSANHVIAKENITKGDLTSCILDVRCIVKTCLIANAVSVIMAHNHPGGGLRPSSSDIKQTARLKKALDLFEIKLLDHIIVTDDGFYSFAEGEHKALAY